MKKTLCITAMAAISFIAVAQGSNPAQGMGVSEDVFEHIFNICSTIFVVILAMIFILSILRRMLDYRLKNKIADKGVSENIASSILQSDTKEDGTINMKWFCILAGIGIGLTIINYTLPLGIHSLAVMSFSIALGFLSYHYYLKRSAK